MDSRSKLSRHAYLICAILFATGILAQVFLVGLSLLGRLPSWQIHVGLGHTLGILALLLVVLVYLGRLPSPFRRLTWITFGVYVLLADIVIFMRDSVPVVSALHPVLAMTLFAFTSSLALRAWRLMRPSKMEAPSETLAAPLVGER